MQPGDILIHAYPIRAASGWQAVALFLSTSAVEVTRDTVRKWRSRFLEDRLDGLGDALQPGAPRTISDEQVELVIANTLAERGPAQDTHWSTRSMAAAAGMSPSCL